MKQRVSHRNGADIPTGVVSEGAMGTDEGAPTTTRLHEVLNRAVRVVIAEGSPDEADSASVARLVVTGVEIAGLPRRLAVVDGGTGDRCLCWDWPTIMGGDVNGELIASWAPHHQTRVAGGELTCRPRAGRR